MFKEFKEFALKGNMLDLAVGIIIGAAFGAIITSLVKDVIMPPLGLVAGNLDFKNLMWVLKDGKVPGYLHPRSGTGCRSGGRILRGFY